MIKPLIRRAVRGLAVRVLERPALAASAKLLLRQVPALDRRLRRMVRGEPAPVAEPPQPAQVPPEVARVLFDLRRALQDRERRSS